MARDLGDDVGGGAEAVEPDRVRVARHPERAIQRVDQYAYVSYAPRVYFVRFDGTAASLAAAIGFTAESNQQVGLVLPAKDGYGYAATDLWDWLKK